MNTHPISDQAVPAAGDDGLRAALRSIHRDLSMVEHENTQLRALLALAGHAALGDLGEHGELASALARALTLADDMVDRLAGRIGAAKSSSMLGYAAEGGVA